MFSHQKIYSVVFLNSSNHSNGRLARLAMRLQPTFQIRYHPGASNVNADALSRLVDVDDSPSDDLRPLEEGGDVRRSS